MPFVAPGGGLPVASRGGGELPTRGSGLIAAESVVHGPLASPEQWPPGEQAHPSESRLRIVEVQSSSRTRPGVPLFQVVALAEAEPVDHVDCDSELAATLALAQRPVPQPHDGAVGDRGDEQEPIARLIRQGLHPAQVEHRGRRGRGRSDPAKDRLSASISKSPAGWR